MDSPFLWGRKEIWGSSKISYTGRQVAYFRVAGNKFCHKQIWTRPFFGGGRRFGGVLRSHIQGDLLPIFVKLETFFATNKKVLSLPLGQEGDLGGVLRSHIQGDNLPIFEKLETIFATNKYLWQNSITALHKPLISFNLGGAHMYFSFQSKCTFKFTYFSHVQYMCFYFVSFWPKQLNIFFWQHQFLKQMSKTGEKNTKRFSFLRMSAMVLSLKPNQKFVKRKTRIL